MIRVKSHATMYTVLEWEGEVPDNIDEDERWRWIKENVGGEFFEADPSSGDWEYGTDVVEVGERQ